MNKATIRLSVIVFTAICILLLILINVIPRNNFISGPAISLIAYIPLLIFQSFLLLRVFSIEKPAKWFFYVSLIITLVFSYLFLHFLATTS